MIVLKNISKRYTTRQGSHLIFDDINLTIHPGEKIGILGRNGAGKSTLIRLMSGAELPTSGNISRKMSISWPLAFSGGFQGSLTGLDNLRFICRIYNVDIEPIIPQVEDFAELGEYFYEPVKTYSSGMSARLAFAISLSINFDCFLIDEVVAVGDSRFHKKCQTELFEKRKDRAMIIVSHQPQQIMMHCDRAAVLHEGKLHCFDDVPQAYRFYQTAS
ncbi:ABC transporter ATP-binding protein [Candidatus Falkowbacteria bacterium]|nr:ABC transporter ATP-binding protein [Candidatus Falkowbacteria bacterium]